MTSTNYPVTVSAIKNYLLRHSLLGTENLSIDQVLNHYRCIQVDPIDVVAKSHELALFNRVSNFSRQDLQLHLYQKRDLFEYWLQMYSIIPIRYFPNLSARRAVQEDWHKQFHKQHQNQLNQVRLYIQSHGPTSSFDLVHIQSESKSLFSWSNSTTNSSLLEYLWDKGEIAISYRRQNRKYYDFTWRLFPNITQTISKTESRAWILESFFHYFGILRANKLNRVGYARNLELSNLLSTWIEQGKVIPLSIPEISTKYYILASQISLIESTPQTSDQLINILPPLDPMVIDRQILQDIFDFTYTWEAYMPAHKRKFGYYGMPVLYRNNFVGQIELVKSNNSLAIKTADIPNADSSLRSLLNKEITRMSNFIFHP